MIIIYTTGKVGSTALEHTLKQHVDDVCRTHMLAHHVLRGILDNAFLPDVEWTEVFGHAVDQAGSALRMHGRLRQLAKRGERAKIISGVREPVAQAVAWVFEALHMNFPDWESRFVRSPHALLRIISEDVGKLIAQDLCGSWFREELESYFGFGAHDIGFDPADGVKTLSRGPCDFMFFKAESFGTESFRSALSAYLRRDIPELERLNVGDEKATGRLYKLCKSYRLLDAATIGQAYNQSWFAAFYSAGERERFTRKWSALPEFPDEASLRRHWLSGRAGLGEEEAALLDVGRLAGIDPEGRLARQFANAQAAYDAVNLPTNLILLMLMALARGDQAVVESCVEIALTNRIPSLCVGNYVCGDEALVARLGAAGLMERFAAVEKAIAVDAPVLARFAAACAEVGLDAQVAHITALLGGGQD